MSKYHSQTPFFALLTNLLWDFSVDKNNNKVCDNYTVVEGGQSVWNQDCQRLWILVEPMAVASPCPALYCQRRNPLSPQLLLRLCSPPSRLLNFWWDQPILAKSGMSPFKMGNSGTMVGARGGGSLSAERFSKLTLSAEGWQENSSERWAPFRFFRFFP